MDRPNRDIPTEPVPLSDPRWLPLASFAFGGLIAGLWHLVVSVPAVAAIVLTIVIVGAAAVIALMLTEPRA